MVEEEIQHYRNAILTEINQETGLTQPITVDSDPLKWWRKNEVVYPHLAKLAKRYLSVQATSVASERVFSTAGDLVSAERSCLSPENVNKLIFLKKNLNIDIDML